MTQAEQIANFARFGTSSNAPQVAPNDVNNGVLIVDQHQWQHLPKRAKTFGATVRIGRGWHPRGRAYLTVTAPDSSTCDVVLEG